MTNIPWNFIACVINSWHSLHTLELLSFHSLINSLTFLVTLEPNQVIEKIVLSLDKSLPLSKIAFSIPLL